MALVSRSMALALPLAFGLACTHARSSQSAAAPAGNADISGNGSQPAVAHSDDQLVAGRVVDATADSISIDTGQGEPRTLAIVPQTVVTVDDEAATPGDIEQGQDVRASFNTGADGRDVAVRIAATRPSDKG